MLSGLYRQLVDFRSTDVVGDTAVLRDAGEVSNFPQCELAEFRKTASFDWALMRTSLTSTEAIRYENRIWRTMENDPIFERPTGDMLLIDQRERLFRMAKRVFEYDFTPDEEVIGYPLKVMLATNCLAAYDWELSTKYLLNWQLYCGNIQAAGTDRHEPLVQAVRDFEHFGCFALTEIAHGSNTKAMETSAVYDPASQEFIVHTPNLGAVKCWSGNLGISATHAMVYAQLFTPKRPGVSLAELRVDPTQPKHHTDTLEHHGLCAFVVPVREPRSMRPVPGVTVGDMGMKIGLRGLDNGFVAFNGYRLAREYLLNKTGDVTPDGRFITPYKDPTKRLGAALGALSGGRVGIAAVAADHLGAAVTIAIRYSLQRKQFGPVVNGVENEVPVMDYPLQAALGKEIHAMSCAAKPMVSWAARDCIQECREACGGHGYLHAARLGPLRDNNDPNMTFEGDNNVILQQTANFILSAFSQIAKGEMVTSPLGSIDLLCEHQAILRQCAKANEMFDNIEGCRDALRWLVCYLVRASQQYLSEEARGLDQFWAKAHAHARFFNHMTLAYLQLHAFELFRVYMHNPNTPAQLRAVLERLLRLFAISLIQKYINYFYEGAYFSGSAPAKSIRDQLFSLCDELRPEACALVDAIAPPDFILASVLGRSDGKAYDAIYSSFFEAPWATQRPDWWRAFAEDKPTPGSRQLPKPAASNNPFAKL